MRGQGWGIDSQIKVPTFGLIRPVNLFLAGGAEAEAPVGVLQGQVLGVSLWGARGWRSGGLDITFLLWLRGELCILFLVGIEPKTPQGSSWTSQAALLRRGGCYSQWS